MKQRKKKTIDDIIKSSPETLDQFQPCNLGTEHPCAKGSKLFTTKDHSIFKMEKIVPPFNQRYSIIIIRAAQMFIDWSCFSGEPCDPWASFEKHDSIDCKKDATIG